MYPINDTALEKINNSEILNGRGIIDAYIMPDYSDFSALYIGMLGGKGLYGEGFAIKELLSRINYLSSNNLIRSIFTRGATSDGKRSLDNFGFKKISKESEISFLNFDINILDNNRINRHIK